MSAIWLHDTFGNRSTPGRELLAKTIPLSTPQLPGFDGNPDGIDGPEDIVFWLLDLLGDDRPALIGCGLGGWMAAELAVRYPERLSALVLVDAYGLQVPGALAEDEFALTPRLLRPLLFTRPESPEALDWLPDQEPPERHEATLRARVGAARLAWQFPYSVKLRSRLVRARVPSLVVWGAEDRLVPAAHGHAYASGLPEARLEILPGVAHSPDVEAPQRFVDVVGSFLRKEILNG